jgi:hypothetical protein
LAGEFGLTICLQLKAGVKEYLSHELRQGINATFITTTMQEVEVELRAEMKDVIAAQFDGLVMEAMRTEIVNEVKEIRQVLKEKFSGSILTHMKYEIMEDMANELSYEWSEEPEENGYSEPGASSGHEGSGQTRWWWPRWTRGGWPKAQKVVSHLDSDL